MKKVVLYGAGLEGEKFFVKYQNKFEIVFCIDQRSNRLFHNIPVYTIEEIEKEVKKYLIVVASTDSAYLSIKDIAINNFFLTHGIQ